MNYVGFSLFIYIVVLHYANGSKLSYTQVNTKYSYPVWPYENTNTYVSLVLANLATV